MPRSVLRPWGPLTIVVTAFLLTLALYPELPERFATHWNAGGQPNGWSSRAVGAFLVPGIMLLQAAFFLVLPRLDPRRANYDKFGTAYALIANTVLGFQLVLHAAILQSALGHRIPIDAVVVAGIGVLMVVIGAVMPRTRSNFFVGIRTPWTLSSDDVWARTHRVAGYSLTIAGIVAILSLALPPRTRFIVLIAAVASGALIPVIYSYVVWARHARRDERGEPPV
jgi:uncharacterized membrane protein